MQHGRKHRIRGRVKKEGLTIHFKSSLRYFRMPCVLCRSRSQNRSTQNSSKFFSRSLFPRVSWLFRCSRVRKTSFRYASFFFFFTKLRDFISRDSSDNLRNAILTVNENNPAMKYRREQDVKEKYTSWYCHLLGA